MVKAQQAYTAIALVVLSIAVIAGLWLIYAGAVMHNGDLVKWGVYVFGAALPTLSAIAQNAIQSSKERAVIEQPKDWKGTVIYVASENQEAVKAVLAKIAQQ